MISQSRKHQYCSRMARMLCIIGIGVLVFAHTAVGGVDRKDLKVPDEGNMQVLKMNDGTTLTGRITEVRAEAVVFESSVGSVTVEIGKIASVEEVSQDRFKGGQYWFPNPNRTRLYIGSTARMLEQGAGYFMDVFVFFPSLSYGLTNNVTITGGGSIFPGVDAEDQIFFGTLKVGLAAGENFDVAASGLVIRVPDWDDDDDLDEPVVVGSVAGMATYGTDDASVTAGLGFGYADDDFADKPVVTLGGEYRISRRMSLVSENWIIPEVEDPLVSYGVRFFGEGLAVDLAFVNVASGEAIFPGIPFVSFVWNF